MYSDPTGNDFTWETVFDIIIAAIVLNEVSLDMIEIFGYDFTESFFELLGNIFSLIPSSVRIFVDIIKTIPTYIWEILEDGINETIDMGGTIVDLAISYVNAFFSYTQVSFFEMFATWAIGFLPAELALLLPGIILDDSLNPSQKLTLIFVDSISIIASNAISFATSALDISGVLKVISTVASIVLPVATDLISKFLMKRNNN